MTIDISDRRQTSYKLLTLIEIWSVLNGLAQTSVAFIR